MKKKVPKLRAWGKSHRKVATMVIPSKKQKLNKRSKAKEEILKEITSES